MAKNKLISDAPIISMYANQFSFLARPLSRDMAIVQYFEHNKTEIS